MALTTLAQGQGAVITLPAPFAGKVIVNHLTWGTKLNIHDVTGVESGGDPAGYPTFDNSCLGDIRGVARCVPYVGTTYGTSCGSTFTMYLAGTTTLVAFKAYDYVFSKTFHLFDVTSSGDAVKKWAHGRPMYVWKARGFINTTSDGLDDLATDGTIPLASAGPSRAVTVEVDISQVGLIKNLAAGDGSKIMGIVKQVPFKKGGPVEVEFTAVWNKGVGYTASGGSSIPSANDVDMEGISPSVGELIITQNDGVVVTHNIVIESIAYYVNPRVGDPVKIFIKWRYDS